METSIFYVEEEQETEDDMRTEMYKNKWFWIIVIGGLLIVFGIYVWQKGITIGGLTIGGK